MTIFTSHSAFLCRVAGDGFHSRHQGAVQVLSWELEYDPDAEVKFGEFRVFFDSALWNVKEKGPICTDRTFEHDLATSLGILGFPKEIFQSMFYSDLDKQTDTYVAFEVLAPFVEYVETLFER